MTKAEFHVQSRVDELEATLHRVLRKLDHEKRRTESLVKAVYEAARDAANALRLDPVVAPRRTRHTARTAETAVALLSDLQLAKRTPDYNTEMCEQRVRRYGEKIAELTEIQRSDHPVKNLIVPAIGDMIEGGADIFPGQVHLVDASLYRQITVDGPRIIVNFLRFLLSHFDTVHVEWIIGNHGRIGRKGEHDPETNGDRMLGRIVQMLLANEPRITFNVPDGAHERNWYSVTRVGKWSALCIHGDQVKGHSGFPWYGLGKRVNSWAAGAIREPFRDVLMGHWHQIADIPLNHRSVYVNGSTESYNTHAQENLAAMSNPAQWLLFAHPDRGHITSQYKVWL